MSLIQVEDLVSYQLRTSYLTEVADGVGERLITINDSFLNTAPFKAAGWRSNPAHIKRTHSPPIPTAVASEYFQAAPRAAGLTLEDDAEEGGMLTGGGGDTLGPASAIKRRRERRREQMEDDDSSDLSDESDDETDQRAAQQIRFAKMPVRSRAGSSPIQSSNLRQVTSVASPRQPPGARRGSQSALGAVKERVRRDTVTSSEFSSENEFDASGYRKLKAATRTARSHSKSSDEPTESMRRKNSEMLLEEEEEDSDLSDASSAFIASVDSTSLLDTIENPVVGASPSQQVVGTVPKQILRQSTIRKIPAPPPPPLLDVLPPPRPMSVVRPLSIAQPRSLLAESLNQKKAKDQAPFDQFASLSGQGDPDPLRLRIYAPSSLEPESPFEVLIRRNVQDAEGSMHAVLIAELIGLSLWRYTSEKREPPIPAEKSSVNWWTLRMVEEGGEVDDDFEPLDRTKPVVSFTTANNRAARSRSASKPHDDFALVQASPAAFAENKIQTPQFEQQASPKEETPGGQNTPNVTTPPEVDIPVAEHPRPNPIINTTFRGNLPFADKPAAPPPSNPPIVARGQKRLLRIHLMTSELASGTLVTLEVTTETYIATVLEQVCLRRQLDKNSHVLKLPVSGAVVYADRTIASIGNVMDLELHRRRFGTDGPLIMQGSPGSPSPKTHVWDSQLPRKGKKKVMTAHPLAQESLMADEPGSGNTTYKKYVVWRKQTMRFAALNERIIAIDGEYIYIMHSAGGKVQREGGKTATVHFSNVVGCSMSHRHPNAFKLIIFRDVDDKKRYDFEAKNPQEAAEIVRELKKGVAPYNKGI
ncbi:SIN1-domain-containing protein [Xylariaceae sp. FL0255]|nr:SIN1-domain-containing protein [Xylariaceae sp. FL0255]